MKLYNIITIIFLASLILLIPLVRPADEYKLTPFKPKTIVINVQNSFILISADIPAEIDITAFYLDPSSNDITEILATEPFSSKTKIDVSNRGFYRLDFLSEDIVTITISTSTLPNSSRIILSFTTVLMIIFQLRKQFSRSFAY